MKLTEGFNLLATAPDGIKRLRELILSLAVQGKLVPQDANDEPASELLKQIRAEKDRLILEGKIKKDKPLAAITDDEKPFQLPDGWEWVRVGDVGVTQTGGTPTSSRPDFFDGNFPFIGPGQITPSGQILAPEKFISEIGRFESAVAEVGDVLMVCIGGSIGKSALATYPTAFNQQINSIHPLLSSSEYILSAMSSLDFVTSVIKTATGSATPIISKGKWDLLLLPLPPLAEQSRIVAKVEELMALCDALETRGKLEAEQHARLTATLFDALAASESAHQLQENWARLASNFDLILDRPAAVDALEQTLLQLAVRGLLVEQNPNDEPASELLKQICAEKDRLIAEGKIKKDKPLPAITDEEKPFALPQGWEWARLGTVILDLRYGTASKCDYLFDGVPVLRIPNIGEDYVCLKDMKFGDLSVSEQEAFALSAGELLMIRSNGSASLVGKTAIVSEDAIGHAFAGYLVRLKLPQFAILPTFAQLALKTTEIRTQIEAPIRTTSGVKNINSTEISNLRLPLAPLAEQFRIVARVEALRTLCADLRQRLTASQKIQTHLAETLVENSTND